MNVLNWMGEHWLLTVFAMLITSETIIQVAKAVGKKR